MPARNLGAIRKSLNIKPAKIAAAVFTTSSLDHCNTLLHVHDELPKNGIQKTQFVQTSAARVVMSLQNHDHITQARKELH